MKLKVKFAKETGDLLAADGTKLATLNKADGALKGLKMADKEGEFVAKLDDVVYGPTGKAESFSLVKQPDGKLGWKIGEKGVASADELAKAFINGWTKEKILALPKGSRPDPSEYLNPEYIAKHLAKFEQEGTASRIVLKKDYEAFGIGKPDVNKTEFVSTKSTIDEILKLPLTEQARKLGIPVEQIRNGEVVRIDYKISSKNKVFMPSGNEWSTNTQWIPGGKLPDGDLECIIKTKELVQDIDYIVTTLH